MKFYKIIFATALASTLFSCQKLIEIKETDAIAGEVALKTVTNNEQSIIGAYAGLGIEMGILMNATFSDEVKRGEFYNAGTTHEWQYTSTDIGIRDNYTAIYPYYVVIDRVNRVLQALPTADSTKAGDETLRSKLKGEALFLRAFAHFELFRFYCGNYTADGLALMYMETPSLLPYARMKMGPFFDKLKADLAAAKALVPNNLTDIGRATKLAVVGLQARVSLYMMDWTSANTFATEYIAGLPLASMANFPGIWTDANSSEVAFSLKRSTTAGGKIGSLFRGASTTTAVGTVTWLVSDKLWAAYDKVNDVRFAAYLKDESMLSAAGRPSHIIYKYAGGAYGTPSENLANAKVFRTGEMYLIRAEAKAENNDLTGAAADINALRAARITGYTNVTFASKSDAITAIIDERFKELPYEGHRFWDLRRKNLPVVRTGADAPTAAAATLPAGNFRFLLPIPNSEINANPLMEQNPGYTN